MSGSVAPAASGTSSWLMNLHRGRGKGGKREGEGGEERGGGGGGRGEGGERGGGERSRRERGGHTKIIEQGKRTCESNNRYRYESLTNGRFLIPSSSSSSPNLGLRDLWLCGHHQNIQNGGLNLVRRVEKNMDRALPCCLFDLACFFLPSFSSLIKTSVFKPQEQH